MASSDVRGIRKETYDNVQYNDLLNKSSNALKVDDDVLDSLEDSLSPVSIERSSESSDAYSSSKRSTFKQTDKKQRERSTDQQRSFLKNFSRPAVDLSFRSGSSKANQTKHGSSPARKFDKGLSPENPPSPRLPDISERLGQLRPSRELLEYYRKKIADYDDEHNEIMTRIDDYKITCEDTHQLQWEIRQREEEIIELQKALSDMQVYLFEEKEHVLRLYAENDRLKIRELEDKKKIQRLLSLDGFPDGEITYFHKEPPAVAIVEQALSRKVDNTFVADSRLKKGSGKKSKAASSAPCSNSEGKYEHDRQTLTLQIECLQAQIEEQVRLSKEHIDALLEDRNVKEEEYETRRLRDEEKIKVLSEKLRKTQELLYDSTTDFLELRYQDRAKEQQWMSEKDSLLQELDKIKEFLDVKKASELNMGGDYEDPTSRRSAEEEIKALEFELNQSHKVSEMYREQVIQMENELSRIREEGDVTREIFKDRSEKMSKRLGMMNSRYQELERRRNFEVEGFKTDVKNLRGRLRDVERQLYRVTLGMAEELDEKRPDDLDLRILRNVRMTAGRSKKIMGELKNLKAKVYGMENDLKHL